MFLAVVLVFLLTVLFYYYVQSLKNVWKEKGVFHLRRSPIFGNVAKTFFLQESFPHLGRRIYDAPKDKDTKLVGFYIFNRPCLLIRDPAILKHILVKDFSYFPMRNFHVSSKHDSIASKNMFVVRDHRWKPIRSSVSPIFTSGKLKNMFPIIKEVAVDLLAKLKQEHKQQIDIRELSAKYTTDIISTTAFGFKANCLTNEDSQFRRFGKYMFGSTYWRTFELFISVLNPTLVELLRTRIFSQEATDSLSEVFWEILNDREEKNFKRNDLIDLFIELKKEGKMENDKEEENIGSETSEKGLSKLEILGTAVSFFAAGFETTATTIAYTLFQLAFNPDLQDRLITEIHETMKKHNGELTYEALQEMKFLEHCVDETLRMYPLTGLLFRECVADYRIPDTDVVIDKGTEICICVDGIQQNEKYFPNPDKYDPDRFSDSRKHEIEPFTYLPFGAGPRNCIGLRFGLLNSRYGVAAILSNYKVEPTPSLKNVIEFSNMSFLLTPKNPINLKFTPMDLK